MHSIIIFCEEHHRISFDENCGWRDAIPNSTIETYQKIGGIWTFKKGDCDICAKPRRKHNGTYGGTNLP